MAKDHRADHICGGGGGRKNTLFGNLSSHDELRLKSLPFLPHKYSLQEIQVCLSPRIQFVSNFQELRYSKSPAFPGHHWRIQNEINCAIAALSVRTQRVLRKLKSSSRREDTVSSCTRQGTKGGQEKEIPESTDH